MSYRLITPNQKRSLWGQIAADCAWCAIDLAVCAGNTSYAIASEVRCMTNSKQETIAHIVADIRAQNQGLPEDSYALSPLVCDLLSFADRIEAAARREREAGAEVAEDLQRRCAK